MACEDVVNRVSILNSDGYEVRSILHTMILHTMVLDGMVAKLHWSYLMLPSDILTMAIGMVVLDGKVMTLCVVPDGSLVLDSVAIGVLKSDGTIIELLAMDNVDGMKIVWTSPTWNDATARSSKIAALVEVLKHLVDDSKGSMPIADGKLRDGNDSVDLLVSERLGSFDGRMAVDLIKDGTCMSVPIMLDGIAACIAWAGMSYDVDKVVDKMVDLVLVVMVLGLSALMGAVTVGVVAGTASSVVTGTVSVTVFWCRRC